MSLKNLTRETISRNGQTTWRLRTAQGQELEAFTRFAEFAEDYSPRTTKRYLEVVGRFLDYLIEAGVFEPPFPTTRRLNAIIDAYPLLLRDGAELTVSRIRQRAQASSDDDWLVATALGLGWSPMKASSLGNTLAAVNHFLTLSESLAREELERATLLGIKHNDRLEGLIRALQGTVPVSLAEVQRMRQNSMLGSVAKFAPKGLRRPKRLRGSGRTGQSDTRHKDFPIEHVKSLVEAATCWRDKALWLLLAASGIRTSEARNLLLDDIVAEEQRVYVLDPDDRRFKPPSNVLEHPRFKGRQIAATYLFPPFREWFFEALEQYLNLEYVPTADRYLFQYVEPTRRGEPLVNASDAALAKQFKKAVHRAGIPLPFDGEDYTPHSLRHTYGVYMVNDYPVDPKAGRFGLPLTDVQMLMGHARLSSTQVYARRKSERVMQKLEASDRALLSLTPAERLQLPAAVVQHLEYRND